MTTNKGATLDVACDSPVDTDSKDADILDVPVEDAANDLPILKEPEYHLTWADKHATGMRALERPESLIRAITGQVKPSWTLDCTLAGLGDREHGERFIIMDRILASVAMPSILIMSYDPVNIVFTRSGTFHSLAHASTCTLHMSLSEVGQMDGESLEAGWVYERRTLAKL
ncbi:hypothetical protein B0H14DRAFT_2964449 [Mycena olivaceomarginata]|nr:hypothetical protein B0H14DRAFT_2964449 [Mycena olivaceomarginata]